MSYKVNLGAWNGIFAVPDAVVDNYLKIASGVNIKVLLFLLRNAGKQLDGKAIASAVSTDEETVRDALLFWEQMKILKKSDDEYAPSEECVQNKSYVPRDEEAAKKAAAALLTPKAENPSPLTTAKKVQLERDPDFRPVDIAKVVRGSNEVDYLFKKCEELTGKPLKHTEQNALMVIFDENGLPIEITLILVEYCHSVGKLTPAYMKSVAKNWIECEINTIEKAENHVQRLRSANSTASELKKLFEMQNAFTDKQKRFISDWTERMNFSTDMIYQAYQQTLDNIGKMKFEYMDKILQKWYEDKISEPSQINSSKRGKPTDNTDSSFDAGSLDQISMEKYRKK